MKLGSGFGQVPFTGGPCRDGFSTERGHRGKYCRLSNPTKLHAEFGVRQNSKAIDAIFGNAGIVSASRKKTDNLPALATKGRLAADTQKLDAALTAARAADAEKTVNHEFAADHNCGQDIVG
jgi:hypothetical protein